MASNSIQMSKQLTQAHTHTIISAAKIHKQFQWHLSKQDHYFQIIIKHFVERLSI